MSALTRDTLHPVKSKLSAAQVQDRRRKAEKILGRKLPASGTASEGSAPQK